MLVVLLCLVSPGCGGGTGQRGLHESGLEGVMYFGGECGDVFEGIWERQGEKREERKWKGE